ncbi:hypothetical protein LTR37_010599 [Vermiconidia calcicola]|uniref:Uncharacterized protein n=1 Tax=Vermiconidia calcicola TaxID=1690605 RepID=A0ACC3N7F0_9PEZI|nr:hypothetical protein LTR37_010599 [Vermiconidia calcicola]
MPFKHTTTASILLILLSTSFVSALNITVYQANVAFAPLPLPYSHADSDGDDIIALFQNLGRNTVWKSIANISFEGDTFEPEGIVRLGPDRYIVSAGQWTEPTVPYNATINGTDRSTGAGFSHLIVFDGEGSRIADATITRRGDIEYHNGGIDFDGKYLWGTIAQYRPNSTAYVYKARPETLEPEPILHYNDHLGGVVHDVQTDRITALNWGSRNASTWDLDDINDEYRASSTSEYTEPPEKIVRNPSHFIDYQDCKFLGHSKHYQNRPVMLCGGIAAIGSGDDAFYLGGIALVDVTTMLPLGEVPIALRSALGIPLTVNPIEASVENGKLRLYLLPDQNHSTLYIMEAQ